MWIWYLDRAAGLVALVALWCAVLTGIAYNRAGMRGWHRLSRVVHTPVSVVASVTLLLHVGVGLVDTGLVLGALVPHPAYSDAYLLVGVALGAIALLITVTATLAFLDPRRFERPWDPRLVHAFAYFGFLAGVIHAVAVGSDLATFAMPAVVAATLLLLAALVARVALPEPAKA